MQPADQTTITLDKPIYFVMGAMVVFLLSFIAWYFIDKLRSRRPSGPLRGAALIHRAFSQRPSASVTILAALFLSWLLYKFYTEFYAIEFSSDRIRLLYPVPRPPVTLLKGDISDIRIIPVTRKRFLGAGYMEIVTRNATYRTGRLRTFSQAVEVKEKLSK
jgi:hypothetical protein